MRKAGMLMIIVAITVLSLLSCSVPNIPSPLVGSDDSMQGDDNVQSYENYARLILRGPDGRIYLINATVGGKSTVIKDGNLYVDLPDGKYSLVLEDVAVFEREYSVEIRKGVGEVNLRKVEKPAFDLVYVSESGKAKRVFVMANYGGYHALGIIFEVSRVGGYGAGGGDGYVWVYNGRKAGVVSTIKNSNLGNWIVMGADENWLKPFKIVGYDLNNTPHEISF